LAWGARFLCSPNASARVGTALTTGARVASMSPLKTAGKESETAMCYILSQREITSSSLETRKLKAALSKMGAR
jgi:hypothetical protein